MLATSELNKQFWKSVAMHKFYTLELIEAQGRGVCTLDVSQKLMLELLMDPFMAGGLMVSNLFISQYLVI